MDDHQLQLVLCLHSCQKVVGNQYPHVFAVSHSRESKKPVDVPFGQRSTLRTRFEGVLALLHTGGWQRGLERTTRRGTDCADRKP